MRADLNTTFPSSRQRRFVWGALAITVALAGIHLVEAFGYSGFAAVETVIDLIALIAGAGVMLLLLVVWPASEAPHLRYRHGSSTVYVNPAAASIYGIATGRVPVDEVLGRIHPDDQTTVARALDDMANGQAGVYDGRSRSRQGWWHARCRTEARPGRRFIIWIEDRTAEVERDLVTEIAVLGRQAIEDPTQTRTLFPAALERVADVLVDCDVGVVRIDRTRDPVTRVLASTQRVLPGWDHALAAGLPASAVPGLLKAVDTGEIAFRVRPADGDPAPFHTVDGAETFWLVAFPGLAEALVVVHPERRFPTERETAFLRRFANQAQLISAALTRQLMLKRGAEKNQTFFDESPVPLIVLDHGAITDMNPTFRRLTAGIDLTPLTELLAQAPLSAAPLELTAPDGTIRSLEITTIGEDGYYLVDCVDVTDALAARREQVALTRRLADALDANRTLVQTERQRIAVALHNDVIQELLATRLMVAAAIPRDARSEISDHFDRAIGAVRGAIAELRPHRLVGRTLRDAISVEADRLRALGLTVTVDVDVPDAVPSEIEEAVLRVVEGCCTNIARHAGATTAHLDVRCNDAGIRSCIRDNGDGIPGDAPRRGLRDLEALYASMGGRFRVDSAPRLGTLVEATLPRWWDPVPAPDMFTVDAPPAPATGTTSQ